MHLLWAHVQLGAHLVCMFRIASWIITDRRIFTVFLKSGYQTEVADFNLTIHGEKYIGWLKIK